MAYKVFSNGDALNGSELNTYLMNQSVIQFASATARDAAIPAPAEGQLVWLQDLDKYVYYNGSAWTDLLPVVPAQVAGKNKIINGAFDFWQRGTSFTVSNTAAYTADRWYAANGITSATQTRQLTSDTTNLPFIQYCARIQRVSGQTSTSANQIQQSIDSATSIGLAGKTVAFSFYARAGANYSATSNLLVARLYTGTGTDQNIQTGFTGQTLTLDSTATLTTTWQRFTFTATIPAATTQIGIVILENPTGTAGAADYYEITGVQLEAGSSATSFARAAATLQGELAACQRYYVRYSASGGAPYNTYTRQCVASSSTAATAYFTMPIEMRVSPTSVEYSTLGITPYPGTAVTTVTSATVATNDPKFVSVNIAVASGLTTGTSYTLLANNSASAYFGISAEL